MSQLSSSALERHRLQSILPHPFQPQSQILKSKQFYRPQQFIWNNPHRTSHRIYQYYHAYNQHYQETKAPLIKQLEQKDREQAEQERISRLTHFRNRTRQQFHQTQSQRINLQNKTRQKSTATEPTLGIESRFGRGNQSQVKPKLFSQKMLRTEENYLQGVAKHDLKSLQIQKMIENQNKDYHNKIRSDFIERKQNNKNYQTFIPNRSKKAIS